MNTSIRYIKVCKLFRKSVSRGFGARASHILVRSTI